MFKDLPKLIDPLKLAQHGTTLEGRLPLAQMTRLHKTLCATEGDVSVKWTFALDSEQRVTIQGQVYTTVVLTCQRCLQPMQWDIDTKTAMVIWQERYTEEDLPADFEWLELEETMVSLKELVEDEVILALPIVPVHENCPKNEYLIPQQVEEEFREKTNPFSVLKTIKTK